MLNWEHIIFRSFYYIGILSPFVFFICYLIICTSQYLKQKSEKEQEINRLEKKYKKQNKLNHTLYTDMASESSTESLIIKVENPNQHLYRMNETEMSNSLKDSIKGSSINAPDKRHLKYSDSRLLFPETDITSEDETDPYEELLHSQKERFNVQEESIPRKLKKSIRNVESKYRDVRQEVIHNDNSTIKQCICNSDDKNLYIMQKNKRKQEYSTGNPNYDTSFTIEPVEVTDKSNTYKIGVHETEFEGSSGKNALSNNKKVEKDNGSSTQIFQQYGFENDQEYRVKLTNKPPSLKTHEKCPMCTVSTEAFISEMPQGKSFLHGTNNPGKINKHNEDPRVSLFQNSNIPIAKRVLEDDQFYDLRQKFCSTENTFLNAPKSMKDESCFNTLNKNNNQVYQFDENDYSFKGQKHFEEGNRRNTRIEHLAQTANYTEKTGNENQIENISSTCHSTYKEEELCNFWKSLKMKTDNQKRNKAVQTDIFFAGQNCTEPILEELADEACGLYEQKSQKALSHIQAKQAIPKQAQDTKVKNAQSSTQNQSTQTNGNIKPCTSIESSQIEIMEYHPKVQLFSTQMPYDEKNVKFRTCRNCNVFLTPTNNSEEIIDTSKTGLFSRPTQMQTELQYPCQGHLSLDYAQSIENTENIQYCGNCCFRPNFPMKSKNVYNKYNTDCALQNKHTYICNPIMPMNHYENQYLNTYNDINQRQMQRMCLEQQNTPLRNQFVQSGQHDENKYRISVIEKPTYHKHKETQQQTDNRQMSNFCKSPNKISVATHQHIQNSSIDDFKNQTNSCNDGHGVIQENGFHDRHRDKKYKDNSTQYSLHNFRNNRSKIQNNEADTDIKGVQASKEISIAPNSAKEYGKQTLKEAGKKPNSQIKVNTEQAIEKSNAEQIQAKENVLKQIKRMYAHIDQNVHETNKNVITQVKGVLKTKGMWHTDNK